MDVIYRTLELDECNRIREIDASQYIAQAWRDINGSRQLIEINYQEPDFPNGFENHLTNLKNTISTCGIVLGAFYKERLVGFCSVDNNFFGDKNKYVLLDQLFVSNELRDKGIGRNLFFKAAKMAQNKGADKFYICAGSAEETIAFYFSIGCEEAKEINQELYQMDTRDYQLEYDFTKL